MGESVYERFAGYDQVFAPRHLRHPFVRSVARLIVPLVQGDVLDIGTGDGYKLSRLLEARAGKIKSATALEPSPLRSTAATTLEPWRCTVEGVSWSDFFAGNDHGFDTVIAFEVIEHVDDQQQFLDGVRKALRPGGVFICSTPNRPVYRLMCRISGERPDPTHVGELAYREFMALVKGSFGASAFRGFLPFMGLFQKMPALDIVNRVTPFLWWSRTIYCVAAAEPGRFRATTQ